MRVKTTAKFFRLRVAGIFLGGVLNLLVSAVALAENIHADSLTASEIIDRMKSTYANSRTYSDSGVVKTIFTGGVKQTIEKPFTTVFVRPDRFRYAFKDKKPDGREQVFIIHLSGKDVQTYWDVQKDLAHESLDRAVASATGVSSGSAITVPAMLLPGKISWRRSIRFTQPRRIDDDFFNDAECFRLQDLVLNKIPTTLWIDKKTFLLRKIYREQEFDNFRTQETTIYKPNLNIDIPDDLLEFNPPAQKLR